MLLFQTRELITLPTFEKLSAVREALSAAGISSTVKIRGAVRGVERARTGSFGLPPGSGYTYAVYVRKQMCIRDRRFSPPKAASAGRFLKRPPVSPNSATARRTRSGSWSGRRRI